MILFYQVFIWVVFVNVSGHQNSCFLYDISILNINKIYLMGLYAVECSIHFEGGWRSVRVRVLQGSGRNLHVLHSDVLQDLAVVHIPHGLVVPDFRGQQDGAQDNPLPVARADVHLSVCQQPLQVNLAHADEMGLVSEWQFPPPKKADSIMGKQGMWVVTRVTIAHSAVSCAELKSVRMKR